MSCYPANSRRAALTGRTRSNRGLTIDRVMAIGDCRASQLTAAGEVIGDSSTNHICSAWRASSRRVGAHSICMPAHSPFTPGSGVIGAPTPDRQSHDVQAHWSRSGAATSWERRAHSWTHRPRPAAEYV